MVDHFRIEISFLKWYDIDIMKTLETSNDVVNMKDKHGYTFLHCAVLLGSVDFTKKLLKMGADVNATSDCGSTPLHIACAGNNDDCINALLDYKPSLNVRNNIMFSPLYTFFVLGESQNEKLLERMLYEGADPNLTNSNGSTPLHYMGAEKKNEKSISFARLLIEYNADITAIDNEGYTPVHYAVENCFEELVDYHSRDDEDINIGPDNDPLLMQSFSQLNHKWNIMVLMGKQLIMKHLCDEQVDMMMLRILLKFDTFRIFMMKCEDELVTLKREIIDDYRVTYYDILKATPRKVERYLRNLKILKSLLIFDESKHIFGKPIVKNFEDGIRRHEAARKLYEIFSFKDPFLPHLCVERIMFHFDYKDLKKIENL